MGVIPNDSEESRLGRPERPRLREPTSRSVHSRMRCVGRCVVAPPDITDLARYHDRARTGRLATSREAHESGMTPPESCARRPLPRQEPGTIEMTCVAITTVLLGAYSLMVSWCAWHRIAPHCRIATGMDTADNVDTADVVDEGVRSSRWGRDACPQSPRCPPCPRCPQPDAMRGGGAGPRPVGGLSGGRSRPEDAISVEMICPYADHAPAYRPPEPGAGRLAACRLSRSAPTGGRIGGRVQMTMCRHG